MSEQEKSLIPQKSSSNQNNNNNNNHTQYHGDEAMNINTRTSIPWYKRTRTRQLFAVLGVLTFVGVLLILIFVYKDMSNNDNNNNNNPNVDPLVATAGVIPCQHPVYCTGSLLDEVQMNQLYTDNMHFVDLPIRYGVKYVLGNFSVLMQQKQSSTSAQWKQMLLDFVDEHFLVNTSDIQDAGVPADFNTQFPGEASISDANLKTFAQDVHTKWKGLYRSFNLSSFCENCSSALELPFPFIVPGGRFTSTFYWDSYWIIQGLITSGMLSTAKKMILNLLSLVSRLGYVPNGSRIFLADRSQPPLLTQMVAEYVAAANDTTLILVALPTLDKEYQFWDKYRRAPLKNYANNNNNNKDEFLLSRFYSVLKTPRPEGYSIDVGIKANAPSWNQDSIYSNLRAGAETGWDFSSRWFKDRATIENCDTNNVVPVDLNAILLRNEQLLESWFASDAAGTPFSPAQAAARAVYYGQQWRKRQQSMLALMWSNASAAFRDIAVDKNDQFTTTPAVPPALQYALYGGATSAALSVQSIADVVKNYGKQGDAVNVITGALVRVGGVGSSNVSNTGQQWDGVDEWAPVVWFTQRAFAALGNQNAAQDLVQKWITQTYCGYNWTGIVAGKTMSKEMWEKYNNSAIGAPGNGGEYTVQTGFGWTNGLTLKWLREFGNSGWLSAPIKC